MPETTPTATPTPRAGADRLRQIADFLDANPAVPDDLMVDGSYQICWHLASHADWRTDAEAIANALTPATWYTSVLRASGSQTLSSPSTRLGRVTIFIPLHDDPPPPPPVVDVRAALNIKIAP